MFECLRNEGSPCLPVNCKICVSWIFFKFNHSIRLDGLVVDFSEDVNAILEESLGHIMYGDYMVNRSSCISCSLACRPFYAEDYDLGNIR